MEAAAAKPVLVEALSQSQSSENDRLRPVELVEVYVQEKAEGAEGEAHSQPAKPSLGRWYQPNQS